MRLRRAEVGPSFDQPLRPFDLASRKQICVWMPSRARGSCPVLHPHQRTLTILRLHSVNMPGFMDASKAILFCQPP